MRIPGYLDDVPPPLTSSPLVDAMGWAEDELFWPAFLLQVGMAGTASEAFDVDLADLDVYCNRFERSDQWPVFTVPVADGTMHLIVCNFPDDCGIDWHLDPRAQDALRRVAGVEPEYAGAGLPWRLRPQDPRHLLMALPAFGDRELATGERATVIQALRAVGATARIEELADDLIRHRAFMIL